MPTPDSNHKPLVILSVFLAPVIGGAIIFYSLKKTNLDIANLGNRLSFVALAVWIAAYFGLQKLDLPPAPPAVNLIGPAIVLVGTLLALVAVSKVRKTGEN